MSIRKVITGAHYIFRPVLLDRTDPPYGMQIGVLKDGDEVQVVKLPGCPRANTMGHCHINKDGKFVGLVHTNSLQPVRKIKLLKEAVS